MFATPAVPASIRGISHPMYRNIYSYNLGNRNLWGTESFLGDWDGETLLVAKDFYPTSYIESAIARGDSAPYRHSPSAPTNRNLMKTLRHLGLIGTSSRNTNCGLLYISACFLLRHDGQKRGPLPDRDNAMRLSMPAVLFTVDNMPHLKRVVLMGGDAARAVSGSGLAAEFAHRGLHLHAVSHPSRAMSDADRFGEWQSIF